MQVSVYIRSPSVVTTQGLSQRSGHGAQLAVIERSARQTRANSFSTIRKLTAVKLRVRPSPLNDAADDGDGVFLTSSLWHTALNDG